jgi:hypothetical protein
MSTPQDDQSETDVQSDPDVAIGVFGRDHELLSVAKVTLQ